ncbi:MAG TPA: tRNA epoxyqueuosine(34) reductase QueG [Bacteroidetes bacterium]|nr:tRNA epoxyqueuosine(34) reductase QueG [Bacteroidota bacterium]
MDSLLQSTEKIKIKAKELGFFDIGISKVERLSEDEKRLKKWLSQGMYGSMTYMKNHFDKRVDPAMLVPGAKSVISLMYNYYTEKEQKSDLKISKYAYGRDYHKVVKKKLKFLLEYISTEIAEVNGRAFVDSAPVLERAWAKKGGLGWIGKNTLLINKSRGSFFFLAELIVDIDLFYDSPVSDHCGNCTRCIDACPTDAISANGYEMNASKCISYLTIENKDEIPDEFEGKMENYIFGCDICQTVCPWNRFAQGHEEKDFEPKKKFLDMSNEDWKNLKEEEYKELFYGTPVVRTKYKGLKRNIEFVWKSLSNKPVIEKNT